MNYIIPFAVNHCDEPILSFSKASGWRVVLATLVWYTSQLCCGVMFMPNTPPSWYPRTVLFGLGYHADRFGQNAFRPHQNRSSWSKPLGFASDAWQTLKQTWHDVTSTRPLFFAPECMSKEDFQREWGQFNRSLNDSFRLLQNLLVEETTIRTVNTNSLGSLTVTLKVPWLPTNMSALALPPH